MIFRYPKVILSRQGISFQWWHGWKGTRGWQSMPVNYWGVWFLDGNGKFRLKRFRKR